MKTHIRFLYLHEKIDKYMKLYTKQHSIFKVESETLKSIKSPYSSMMRQTNICCTI